MAVVPFELIVILPVPVEDAAEIDIFPVLVLIVFPFISNGRNELFSL
jgi:hypothetical protein